MLKNPKTVAGLIVLAVLLILGGILLSRMIPTVQETLREMSLTPTPIPPEPTSVWQVTPDPSLPTPEPVLRSGSRGEDVSNVQSRLKNLGYYTGEVDGQYGAGTKEAVSVFQRQNGLDADGIVGAETRQVLFSAAAKAFGPETTPEAGEENKP